MRVNWRALDIAVTGALVLTLLASMHVREDRIVQSCRLLDIALSEAQMSEAWYLETGRVLGRCKGIEDAKERAEGKACYARRRGGSTEVCQ